MPKSWPLILAPLLATGAGLCPLPLHAARAIDATRAVDTASAPDDPDANWQPGLHAPGMDGRVQAFCDYRGELVVGGTFQSIGPQVIEHIARWDGSAWRALGPGMNRAVSQLTVRGDALIAAGDFTEAGGAPANHIASWDGTTWHPLGSGVDAAPMALAVYRDTLFVGGFFRFAGDLFVRGGIARWDGNGWHDGIAMTDEWPELGVTNLAIAGGRLAATYVEIPPDPGEVPVPWEPHAVLWNGAGWDSISSGLCSLPDHLAVLGDSLYAAGYYCSLSGGGQPDGYYVARWTGTEWVSLGRKWPDDSGIPIGHDGALYLARGGTLYRWTGQDWLVASRLQYASPDVLFSRREGLYAGGPRFGDGSEIIARGMARWDGTAWLAVGDQTGSGLNGWLSTPMVSLAAAGDGFSAGGTFSRVGNLQIPGLVRWDGSSWSPLPPIPGPYRANAFLDLGGRLTAVADEFFGTGCWVRTLEGSRWKDLAWFPGHVLSLTPWRHRLVAGGAFAPDHIMAAPQVSTNPDDLPQSLGVGLNGVVRATCLWEGSVLASGDFTATVDGGVQLPHAGLWDGAAWHPLGEGLPASAITLEPFAGGAAAGMDDGVLDWNGTAWVRLGAVFDGPVQALAVFEGDLVAGGAFTHAGTGRVDGLARWHDDQWLPVGSGMNGEVQDLLVNGDEFWASGAFTAAGRVPSSGIAHWQEPRAGVESFRARVEQDSVTVSWRDPESLTHRSTVVRRSAFAYPTDPQDGLPLPFGEDGRLPASPGAVHAFRFAPLFDGGVVYYSAFAVHADGLCSAPERVQVRLPDQVPPAITLQLRRFADGAPRVAITLRCAEPLVSTGLAARLDSTSVPLTKEDGTGTLWAGTVEVAIQGWNRLTVCARDSVDNEACAEGDITAAVAHPFAAGQCLTPDGRLLVEWPAQGFASEGLVTVIGGESASPTFEVAAHEPPIAPLVLSFQIRPDDPGSGDPRHLGVLGPDGSVQGGVFDTSSGRLVIRTPALGIYRLTSTEGEPSVLADPQFLDVMPAVPNPFRTETTLGFELLARQRARVTVYDVRGRTVAVLFDGLAGPGQETVRWDGRRGQGTGNSDAGRRTAGLARLPGAGSTGGGLDGPVIDGSSTGRALPSGVYFIRMQTDRTSRTVRLVKLR